MLVAGFDKMVNVFIRTLRARMVPLEDPGKTSGIIARLNKLSQYLAGLLVGFLAGARTGVASSWCPRLAWV